MTILHRQDADAVATLTLDAPARLNALSDDMIALMHQTLDDIATDPKVRVVILKATGKAFCAGHDLKEMQAKRGSDDAGRAALKDLFDRCAALMLRIQSLPQPVIAQVHGLATAAGCQLVATCDLAVAAEGVKFGVNGVNIGLFCSTPMVALTRAIGRKAAFEMLTTGQFIDAQRAAELGLVNQVVPPAELDQKTLALATLIAGKLGAAVRIGKTAFYAQSELPTAQAYEYAGQIMVENMLHPSTNEGINAFLDKREPNWAQ